MEAVPRLKTTESELKDAMLDVQDTGSEAEDTTGSGADDLGSGVDAVGSTVGVGSGEGDAQLERAETKFSSARAVMEEGSTVGATTTTNIILEGGSLGLESLLEQAEGNMLTLLATEGPDGTFIILNDTAATGETTGEASPSTGRDPVNELHQVSLVDQLEAELRTLKKNLNESLAKIPVEEAACRADVETMKDETTITADLQDVPSDQEGIAEDSAPVFETPSSPVAAAASATALEEENVGNVTEELVKNSIAGGLMADSLASLEEQVTDLVDFIDDQLDEFIKEECPAMLSESLTTEAAFFPTKAELSIFISLRVSLDLIRCLR